MRYVHLHFSVGNQERALHGAKIVHGQWGSAGKGPDGGGARARVEVVGVTQ